MGLKDTTRCMGYQQVATVTTAQRLSVPAGATMAIIQCEGQAVRWRDDGTAPTAAIGMRLVPGQNLEYDGDLQRVTVIEETAGAKINISFYS